LTGTAIASTGTDRPLLFSFDGAGTTAGRLVKPNKIAIDDLSGAIFVSEGEQGPTWHLKEAISKFNSDGSPAEFSATSTSSLFGTPEGRFGTSISVAVDNSGGPTQGRLYVLGGEKHALSAFAPDGAFLWEIQGISVNQLNRTDVAVDSSGHPWVLGAKTVMEFASSGSPPVEIASFNIAEESRGLDVDAAGDVYVASDVAGAGVKKYVGGALNSTLDPAVSYDVFADQSSSSGHLFTSHLVSGNFNEYDSTDALLGTYGAGAIGTPTGIAYSKPLDRVYVANGALGIVEAFGPPLTGTLPDETIEATSVEGPGTVTFHGSVNPQGVANAYYFEWVEESFTSISGLSIRRFRSPPQSLPEDGSPHAVSYKATNLRGNLEWKVRLVALNTANGLRSVSGTNGFKPPKASADPVVTIDAPSEIGPESVRIGGTINPKEDSAEWKIEYTSDPACSINWASETIEYLPGGEVNAPLPVSYKVEGLTPSQEYCVRIWTRNSIGTFVRSEVKHFTTLPLPPSEVSTAFAAPRTDTSARINGRVNPHGTADFEYQFEWSEDGTTWQQLEPRQSSIDSKEPIVVAAELEDLKPATTYHYRLASAENETGRSENEAGPGGAPDEGTFTTRSVAEMTPAQRGFELVNNPDKGNQNVFFEFVPIGPTGEVPFITPDGSRARWSVTAGSPGSPNGVGSQFLAERTGPTEAAPNGWESRSLAPPAEQQVGGGSLVYSIVAATPDQSRFVADLRPAGLSTLKESILSRLDAYGHEEVLAGFDWPEGSEGVAGIDVSDDGARVLTVDPENHQLVDLGGGSPEIVSLMPDGTPSECGLWTNGPGGERGSFIDGRQWRAGYHPMASADASLVYFGARPNGDCGGPWGLYVRNRGDGTTTLIDPGTISGPDVEMIRATPDGRQAYFLTAGRLDSSDTNKGVDLYRWDQGSEESTCLTCVVANAEVALYGSGVTTSTVIISDDFSHAYFLSKRRLVPGRGVARVENLYVLSNGAIRYVTTPSVANITQPGKILKPEFASLSTDGNVLLFNSAGVPAVTADRVDCGSACRQLYRYDDRDGSIECLSCASVGTTTAPLGGSPNEVANFGLSGDGSTAAFVTAQPLLPSDVNGGTDVYAWHDGVRELLTDGVSEPQLGNAAPGVRGLDADGSNILFSAVQPGLTGFEQDRLLNLYDARVGGGFAPPSSPAHCEGDSCQGPLAAAPDSGRIGSTGLTKGNVTERNGPRPCPKGKVRRRGHCVRRHHRHKHHRASGGSNQGRSK